MLAFLAGACASDDGPESPEPLDSTPDPSEPTLTSPDGARLVPGGVQVCDETEGPRFTRTIFGLDWPAPVLEDSRAGEQGLVVADLDGDGWHDLVLPRSEEDLRVLFGGPGGTFAAREAPTHDEPVIDTIGGSAADADGDGDLDLLLYGFFAPARLLINDGSGHFEVVLIDADRTRDGCGGAAAWGDLDGDGDLDLFLGRKSFREADPETGQVFGERCPSVLLENVDGVWEDRSEQLTDEVHRDQVMAAGWHDLDDDPYPELYVVSDLPTDTPGNRLLDNVDGALVEVEESSLHFNIAGMGLGAGDLDEDGILDFVVPGIGEIRVMESDPAGFWYDNSLATGLYPSLEDDQETAWSAELADLDNDTFLDAIMTYGPLTGPYAETIAEQPDELYLGSEDGSFGRVGEAWAWNDTGNFRGALAVDLDRNGMLDLLKRAYGGELVVDLARCDDASWLAVRVHDDGPNRFAVGATVRVQLADRVLARTVVAGSTSYASGGPPELHFGLGAHDVVDAVEIAWPDGHASTFPAVEGRQLVEIFRR